MSQEKPSVLALNGGSSSIKFALYGRGDPPKRGLHGKVERIGLRGTIFAFHDPAETSTTVATSATSITRPRQFSARLAGQQIGLESIGAIGHRIVNGGASYQRAAPRHQGTAR